MEQTPEQEFVSKIKKIASDSYDKGQQDMIQNMVDTLDQLPMFTLKQKMTVRKFLELHRILLAKVEAEMKI